MCGESKGNNETNTTVFSRLNSLDDFSLGYYDFSCKLC